MHLGNHLNTQCYPIGVHIEFDAQKEIFEIFLYCTYQFTFYLQKTSRNCKSAIMIQNHGCSPAQTILLSHPLLFSRNPKPSTHNENVSK